MKRVLAIYVVKSDGSKIRCRRQISPKTLQSPISKFGSVEKIQMQDLPLIKVYTIASECMELHML